MNTLDNPFYQNLGIEPVIHAAGTKTTHGGTRLHPEVLEAMVAASRSFVSVVELNRRIGAYIADITGAEAGMVTSGAASGVVLSIAACMTGTDVAKVRQLPNPAGMPDQVIIEKIHRGGYSHMYTFTGANFVEIGDMNDCLPREMQAAITERTAAIAYLLGPRVQKVGLSLPQVVAIAKEHGVPVIVDAAAMLPPKANLRRFIDEGADLVVFSGGKMIHGPQNAGLMFGRRDLIDAAFANVSPNHSIGRPHKVSREDMAGLYTALRRYMACDEDAWLDALRSRITPVVETLRGIDGIRVSIEHDDINYNVPVAAISFTPEWSGPSGQEIARLLLNGTPRIFMQYFPSLGHLVVNPISLQPGEVDVVCQNLAKVLSTTAARRMSA